MQRSEEHNDVALVSKGQCDCCADCSLGVELRKPERVDEDK